MVEPGELGPEGAVAELLWHGRDIPSRGPRRGLTLADIAAEAAGIADREGLPALSMQRVAAALGVTKMALYRYVAGKAELDAVMIEHAVEEPPDLAGVPGGWRPRVREFARRLERVWRRHPWLPWATVGARVMGPRELGWVEAAFAAFDGAGLAPEERRDAVFVLFGLLRTTQSLGTAGTQPWTDGVGSVMDAVVAEHATRYPVLAAHQRPAGPLAPPGGGDHGRAFGLDCLLDGIESRLTRAGRTDPADHPDRSGSVPAGQGPQEERQVGRSLAQPAHEVREPR